MALAVAALALLALAPAAIAVTTRAKTATFGPVGGGACPGAALATGTGDLATAAGFGERATLATGSGNLVKGSTAVSNLNTSSGAFAIGESISGEGIPAGTTIAATGPTTLTLSQPATANGTLVDLVSGSREITGLTTTGGAFATGMTVSGTGIAPNTTIAAAGGGTLTLSAGVIAPSGTLALSAGATEVASLSTGCGTFSVGQAISGAGIAPRTTIAATGGGTLTLSQPATATGTGVQLTASSRFDHLGRLVVDQANDKLYALERGANKLHAFDTPSLALSGGAFPLSVSSAGSSSDVAVDNANGRIYYLSQLSNAIYGFDSSGAPLGGNFPLSGSNQAFPCSIAVDSAGNIFAGGLFVIRRFDSAGNPLASIETVLKACSIAIDSNDDLWVTHEGFPTAPHKFTAASDYTSFTLPLQDDDFVTNAFAVDPATDDLYAARPDRVSVFTSAGAFLYDFAAGIPGEEITGVAIDGGTGTAYVSDDGVAGPTMAYAYAYGPAQNYANATATPTAATDVLATSARIGATIDDNNAAATNWRLEVSADGGSSWSTVARGQTAGNEVGAAVSATATGLSLNTDYRFRVVTNKGVRAANDVPSAQLSFKTLNPTNATATPTAATGIGFFRAKIGATIDDNGPAPTRWRLELSADGGSKWSTVGSGQTAGNQTGVAVAATATGLSLNSDYQFRVIANKGIGAATEVASSALSFKTLNAPAAKATPTAPSNITDVGAEIGATIDDNSAARTFWKLQFSTDGGANWNSVASGATAGGQTAAAASATVTGLDPNTGYRFRVLTNKGPGSADVVSSQLSFRTDAPPPVITDIGAIQVTDTSARLVGTIDPRNNPTGYVFEYGTTPALGSATAPLNIGGGTREITVSQVVEGLSKDTEYFFRLVATNLTGTTTSAGKAFHTRAEPPPDTHPGNCPNEAIRQAQGSTFLPDCRAYEMASPIDKNQGSTDQLNAFPILAAGIARDGNGAAFCTNALFGEPTAEAGGFCSPYLSRRTGAGPTGWQTIYAPPRHCRVDFEGFVFAKPPDVFFNAYLDRVAIKVSESHSCEIGPIDPAAPDDAHNLYRRDLRAGRDKYDLLNFGSSANPQINVGGASVGGNADFSQIVYAAKASLTPDAPAGNFDKLYLWEEEGFPGCAQPGGCLSLLSKGPGGAPLTTDSIMPLLNFALPTVSAVGERIYFQSGDFNTKHLYMREGGAVTHDVSASECTAGCGADLSVDAFFSSSSPSGETALFASCDRLTDASAASKSCHESKIQTPDTSSGAKLYRWDRNAPAGHRLTDLTLDHEPSDGEQANLLGVIGTSEDLNVVYFVAGGQIVAGAPAPTKFGQPDGMKLYRSRWNGGNPIVDYLGPYLVRGWRTGGLFEGEVETNRMYSDPNRPDDTGRMGVTPDGKYLMLVSILPLDPAADRDPDNDVYRWSEAEGWVCVSCQLPGAASAGGVNTIIVGDVSPFDFFTTEPMWLISADGQRIFFESRDALLPQDVNGEAGCPRTFATNSTGDVFACQDIYEWHDGALSLITPGTGDSGFALVGPTRDGKSVFFSTRERLVGWDGDGGTDIYVARVGGGFPEPPAQPPACEGEACRGAGTAAPATTGAGSAAFQGLGNPPQAKPRPCPRGKRKVVRNGRARCVAKKRKRNQRAAKHNRRASR